MDPEILAHLSMGQITYGLRLQKETFITRWKPVLASLMQQRGMFDLGTNQELFPSFTLIHDIFKLIRL